MAPSKRSLSTTPTRLNGGMTFQQVLSSQDPDTPWHLHSTCMLWRMAWGGDNQNLQKKSVNSHRELEICKDIGDVANLSTRLVVVEVHERPACWQPLGSLRFIHKCLRESHTIGQVVTAPWPLETCGGTRLRLRWSVLLRFCKVKEG